MGLLRPTEDLLRRVVGAMNLTEGAMLPYISSGRLNDILKLTEIGITLVLLLLLHGPAYGRP